MTGALRLAGLGLALPAMLLAGCASITGSSTQPVSVTTVCEGRIVSDIECTLVNDKGRWWLKTTSSVLIQKSYGDLAVTCRAGPSVGTAGFVSKSNGGAWANLLVGGVIGYAVDSNSGAGFDYPTEVAVVMSPPCPPDETSKEKP